MTKQKHLLSKVSQLIPKHFDKINHFIKTLEPTEDLPEDLKERLKKLGQTPLEEPEIAKKFKEGISQLELPFLFFTDEELISFDKEQTEKAALFSTLAIKQIMEMRDSNGNLKTTPSILAMSYPNLVQIREMNKTEEEELNIQERLNEFYINIDNIDESDREDMEKLESDAEGLLEKKREQIFAFSKLPKQTTKWEKDLAVEIITQYIRGVAQGTPMGKQF